MAAAIVTNYLRQTTRRRMWPSRADVGQRLEQSLGKVGEHILARGLIIDHYDVVVKLR